MLLPLKTHTPFSDYQVEVKINQRDKIKTGEVISRSARLCALLRKELKLLGTARGNTFLAPSSILTLPIKLPLWVGGVI